MIRIFVPRGVDSIPYIHTIGFVHDLGKIIVLLGIHFGEKHQTEVNLSFLFAQVHFFEEFFGIFNVECLLPSSFSHGIAHRHVQRQSLQSA